MNYAELKEKIDAWLDDYRPYTYGTSEFEDYKFYVDELTDTLDVLVIHAVKI